MKNAIATAPNQPTKHVAYTAAQKKARIEEEAANLTLQQAEKYKQDREAEYIDKGWYTPFDLIEDILERGIDAVKTERSAIKAKHKKGQVNE